MARYVSIKHTGWKSLGWSDKRGRVLIRRVYKLSIFGATFEILGMAY